MQFSAFEIALQEIWALDELNVRKILEIAAREHDPDFEAVEAARGRAIEGTRQATLRAGVATIPITGPIFRYANLFTRISGATSIETTAQDLRQAATDPQVKAILLSIDSPGGTVSGTNELAKMVRAAGNGKPVVAYVSHAGASGAYWIASAASQVFVDETAMVGSIGIVAAVIDDSKRTEGHGIKQLTFVSSQSPNKRPDLGSDAGRAVMQARVDKLAQVFIESVARNRGVAAETVMRDFGRGGVLVGRDAVAVGMVDGISSYEEILAGLASGEIVGAGGRGAIVSTRKETDMTDGTAPAARAADEAERERCLAIDELCTPGLEALAAECKADGSTPGQFALRAVAVHKARNAAASRVAPEAVGRDAGIDMTRWQTNPMLRVEFAGDEAAWLAYAEGVRTGRIRHGAALQETATSAADDEQADREKWRTGAALREEFAGNEAAWLAYAGGVRCGRIRSPVPAPENE